MTGTTSDSRIFQRDVAVHPLDRYEHDGRTILELVCNADEYLMSIDRQLHRSISQRVDLCLYDAGVDPHEGCFGPLGINSQLLQERERMVFRFFRSRQIPIAFSLGGRRIIKKITQPCLVKLHMHTVAAALSNV